MTPLTKPVTFTSNLTADFKRQADLFSHQQRDPQKARQVYLNTMAVQAVYFYCTCIGVETDLTASDSWSAVMRTLLDVADLAIKDKGQLECRPVLPGDEICHVPPEVREDRLGYVVVEINEETSEARLLGFSKTAESQLAIQQLSPLENLLDAIVNEVPEIDRSQVSRQLDETNLVRLGQWFQNVFDAFWQDPKLIVATRHRGISPTSELESMPSRRRVKLLDVGDLRVALLLQVVHISDTKRSIVLTMLPSEGNVLPQGLSMQLFDQFGSVFMETQTGRADNVRSLNFQIDAEEVFLVGLSFEGTNITEQFLS